MKGHTFWRIFWFGWGSITIVGLSVAVSLFVFYTRPTGLLAAIGVTYDPTKKKYVGTWIDSMTPGYATMEAELSADGKTMTGTMEGPDMSGKIVKSRETTEWRPDGTRVFTMYGPGDAAGKQAPVMTITYRKRGGAPAGTAR